MAALNLLFLLIGQGQATPTFETDVRLAKPVALAAYAEPVSSVIERLSKATGVPLYADSLLRDDLVIVATKSRPARQTMSKLASHFGWRWAPASGQGYRLEPMPEFTRRAQGGWELEVLPNMRKARDDARNLLTELEKLSPSEVEEARKEAATFPTSESEGVVKDWKRRTQIALTANPITLPVARTIAGLRDENLLSNVTRRIVVSTDPGPLAYRMTDAVQREVAKALPVAARMAEAAFRRDPDHAFGSFDPSKVVEVRFSIEDVGNVQVTLVDGDRHVVYEDRVWIPPSVRPSTTFTLPQPVTDALAATTLAPDPPSKPDAEPLLRFARFAKAVGTSLATTS